MADFEKDRDEVLKTSEDFTNALDSGDSVDAVVGITVNRHASTGYSDVSDEFGSPTGTLSNDVVSYMLGAASSGEQSTGNYVIRVTVTTANGETLVSTPILEVTAKGDPDAP